MQAYFPERSWSSQFCAAIKTELQVAVIINELQILR
jgi:hypothetical protein